MDDVLGSKVGRPPRRVDVFPAGSEPPNGLGMTADEINDGLAFLRDYAKDEKRREP